MKQNLCLSKRFLHSSCASAYSAEGCSPWVGCLPALSFSSSLSRPWEHSCICLGYHLVLLPPCFLVCSWVQGVVKGRKRPVFLLCSLLSQKLCRGTYWDELEEQRDDGKMVTPGSVAEGHDFYTQRLFFQTPTPCNWRELSVADLLHQGKPEEEC